MRRSADVAAAPRRNPFPRRHAAGLVVCLTLASRRLAPLKRHPAAGAGLAGMLTGA